MKCKCNLQKVWAYPETLCLALGSSIIFLKPSCTHKNTNRNSARLFDGFNLLFSAPSIIFLLCFGLSVRGYRGAAAAAKPQSTAMRRVPVRKKNQSIEASVWYWCCLARLQACSQWSERDSDQNVEPRFNRTRGSEWAKKELLHFINQWFRLHWITQEQTVALTIRSCWAKTEPPWA